ncbi:MAG: hypothetical protein GY794_10250 [bacterium]|nr:hypothetical protein [bacterium]
MMQGKMKIIILAVIAVASFAVSYFVSPMLTGSAPVETEVKKDGKQKSPAQAASLPVLPESVESMTVSLKSKELSALITDLRLKLDSCKTKEKELIEREKRIEIAAGVLKKQVQELEQLRLGLIPALQRYQKTKDEIEAREVQITSEEDKNIKLLAARYDSMNAEGAASILGDLWASKQQDLAVKIFYYMQARSSAKVLAAISSSTKKGASALAAELSKKFPSVRKPVSKKG